MDFIFIALGLSTMLLFMFKIEWLFNYKYFLINIFYNIVLFCGSLLMIKYQLGNPKMVVALKMPLISSIVFFLLYILFQKIYKRNPENTFWTFTKKPVQDVIFTLLFWFLGVGLPIYIVA
ncbi:hypothetical protein SAMN05421741_1515 [Paenimyroides ummariense]|uniref:Uncharacterized protein n=1 Tax=Paenimyroides ummariense TaxID=913024 RepID=A0A1I5GVL3_9FLAO|nr:hypothetical protein [Paenimyroides ummariense]SFO39987.1 hypothetical protein SAMN05421741_1515 [Paenimyroides ummariense]